MREIAPSILAADFGILREEVAKVEAADIKYLHLDAMDGDFVPNISFGAPVIKALRPHSKMIFDAHLMVSEPIRYIDDFAKAGCDIITVHVEACEDVRATLEKIRSYGIKAGLSIKPATNPDLILPYLDLLDLVLVMSVEPGFGGQSFIESAHEKIKWLSKLRCERKLSYIIEVDGGIGKDNREAVFASGADLLVMGSAFFKYEDYKIAAKELS